MREKKFQILYDFCLKNSNFPFIKNSDLNIARFLKNHGNLYALLKNAMLKKTINE